MKIRQLRGAIRGALELGAPYFYSGVLGPVMHRLFVYRYRAPDPWKYASSPYEKRKYALKVEILRLVVGDRAGLRALELGCGEGVFTRALAETGLAREIVGVDFVPSALARAAELCGDLPGVSFLEMDVTRELPPGPFDLVLCSELIYYLGPLRRVAMFARRLAGILVPGGHVLLVSSWPAARVLHRPFIRRAGLRPVAEHIERNAPRPYLIQVLQKDVP